jgi:hypothetical protein
MSRFIGATFSGVNEKKPVCEVFLKTRELQHVAAQNLIQIALRRKK